jgi:hypothetical protein
MLRSVYWYLRTDVSGQPIVHILNGRLGLFDPWRYDGYVVPKLRHTTTNKRYVTAQKNEDVIYTAAEAWNHTYCPSCYVIFSIRVIYSLSLLFGVCDEIKVGEDIKNK